MAKSRDLRFPPAIKRLAAGFRRQRLLSEQDEKRQEEESQARRKRIRAERLEQGIFYAGRVFRWATAFRKSAVGKDLIAKDPVWFFDGEILGCRWYGFVIGPQGLLLDPGGRWGSQARKEVHSPRELAYVAEPVVLQTVCEWIDSGKVWECVQRRFRVVKKVRR